MAFVIFITTWLILLVIHIGAKGDYEDDSPVKYIAWLFAGVIILSAIYIMFTVNLMAGLGMIGTLAFFEVQKDKDK